MDNITNDQELSSVNVDRHPNYFSAVGACALSLDNVKEVIDLYSELEKKIDEVDRREQKRDWVIFTSNHMFSVTEKP